MKFALKIRKSMRQESTENLLNRWQKERGYLRWFEEENCQIHKVTSQNYSLRSFKLRFIEWSHQNKSSNSLRNYKLL